MKARMLWLVLLALVGCSETPTEYVAEEFTVSQIARQPGYAWFLQEKAAYQPDTALIAQIRARVPEIARCYLFVNPSCSCNGTQRHFPHFVRCMEDAGLPDTLITIISMRDASTKHNYQSRFQVSRLPTFFIALRSGVDRKIEPPDDPTARIEQYIVAVLEGQSAQSVGKEAW